MKNIHYAGLMGILLFSFIGCKKDNGNLTIYLKDAASTYNQVNVEIKQVQCHLSSKKKSKSGWYDLQTNAGIYDLIKLQNVKALLAQGTSLPVNSEVTEIRLILGTNNSVVVNGTTYPLIVPSGSQSGLKIIGKELKEGDPLTITIDFDANSSVVYNNGQYVLQPVLKVDDSI